MSLSQKLLLAYSATATTVLGVLMLSGLAAPHRTASFDEIEVHRIKVREPDGTLRMVISNQDRLPGSIIKGVEHPHAERKAAGALFYNNQGTETGGLIYGSFLDKDGRPEEANVHLSFDQYMQDQVFTVDAGQENGRKSALNFRRTAITLGK